jgi:hypothetical protein
MDAPVDVHKPLLIVDDSEDAAINHRDQVCVRDHIEHVTRPGAVNAADEHVAVQDRPEAARVLHSFRHGIDVEDVCRVAAPGLHVGRNARNVQIGHAYFLDRGQPVTSLPRFAQVLREDVLPLLEEHCYEDFSTLEAILGTRIVLRGQQRVDETLFEPERHGELIDALLKAFPGITASPAAVEAAERASTLESDEAEGDEDTETPS